MGKEEKPTHYFDVFLKEKEKSFFRLMPILFSQKATAKLSVDYHHVS